MRSDIMKVVIAITFVATLSPQLVFATTPSFSCSSSLVVSLDDGYYASCEGDFSFDDGVLQNDTKIRLTAGGFLNIGANASLIAPEINLYSTKIPISTGASIVAGYPSGIGFNNINSDTVNSTKTVLNDSTNLGLVFNTGAFILLGGNSQPNGLLTNGSLNDFGGNFVINSATGISTNPVQNNNSNFILVSSVPELPTYAMIILGLAFIGLAHTRRGH